MSHAFLGGTIERVRERCAGDFCMVRQTKALMKLPGIDRQYINREMKHLTEAERAMAMKFGMSGRTWFLEGSIQHASLVD